MVKCDLCKEKIEETFLEKFKGTYIGRYKKKKVVCAECQKKHSVDEIKKKLFWCHCSLVSQSTGFVFIKKEPEVAGANPAGGWYMQNIEKI